MIKIHVSAGRDCEGRVHELCEALQHARVWTIDDRRATKHLHLVHSSGTVKGNVTRVASPEEQVLAFDCTAEDAAQEAITAGRFVNLVLRDLKAVSDIRIHRT